MCEQFKTRVWLIVGRVQGVAFRAFTRSKATELGVGGSAENLTDGRVRVVATGPVKLLDRLQQHLQQGPAAARVNSVRVVAETAAVSTEKISPEFIIK